MEFSFPTPPPPPTPSSNFPARAIIRGTRRDLASIVRPLISDKVPDDRSQLPPPPTPPLVAIHPREIHEERENYREENFLRIILILPFRAKFHVRSIASSRRYFYHRWMSDTTMIPLPYIPLPRQSWTHSRKKNRGGKIRRKRLREVERFRFVVGYIRAIHVNITYITQSRRRLIISIYRFISIIHISIYIYLNRREKRRVSRVTFVTDFF